MRALKPKKDRMPIIQFSKTQTPAAVVPKTTTEETKETPETPVVGNTADNSSTTTEVQATNSDEKNAEKVNIVVDGPLGHVYTRALQVMFANEGAVTIIDDNTTDVGQIDAVIYAGNDDILNDAEKVRLALDGSSCNNKMVAIESMRIVTDRKAIGMSYLNSCNISINVGMERLLGKFSSK